MENIKLLSGALSHVLNKLGEWHEKNTEICQRYFPASEFNLSKYFIEELLVPLVEIKNSSKVKEFSCVSRNINTLNKLMEDHGDKPSLFKKNLFKNDELIEFLKEFLKDKIILSMQIEARILLDCCSAFLQSNGWWISKPTTRNKRYSESKWCAMKLAWLYHALARKMPECHHNGSMEETDKEYTGEFYNFLVEVKPQLKSIGINLAENRQLGYCTCQSILKDHKNKLAFLNIDVPSL